MFRNSAHILIAAVLCLVALGLVMLLSVSAFAPDNRGNAMYFITRQSIWLALGLGVCAFLTWTDYHKLIRYAWWILGVSALMVLLAMVPGIGRSIKGAYRWLDLGLFRIQPSELIKLAMVIVMAYWLGKKQVTRLKEGLLIPMALCGGAVLLLVLQPDLGTAMILIALTLIMMFVAGTNWKYLLPIPLVGVGAILALAIAMPQRRGRLMAFLQPELHRTDEGYQVWQALIAFGSGGFNGLGLGNSVQKMFYLPEAHTDFIFPIIGEELGLIFSLIVVGGFLFLVLASGYISYHAPDRSGMLLGIGATSLIAIQAGLNMAVVTSLVPAKGLGLPFISYGGSNLVMCMACLGILLNIHRQALYAQPRLTLTQRGAGPVWQG